MMTVERARPPQIGEYEIVGLLGTGGMAEIFLGRQTATGFQRPVVIKRVLQHLVRQESFVAMFLDEARTLASLRHPNIVQIYDVQRSPEELYMVMEYVEGEDAASVRRRLNHRDETLPRALWAYVLSEVCAGLHAAHQLADHNGRRLNLVHRDISPSNVLITYDGAVKLIDFGIAKTDARSVRTAAGQVKGVFAYMSPEQASGRPIDLRSDLFAIGILLYEFTTGRRLFRRANDLATMQAVCTDPIPPPSAFAADYPPALEAVVMKALQRDPNDRYQSALELRRDLLAVARQFEGIPEELIKVVMQSVFEDRIELKRSILSDQHEAWSRDRMDSVVEVPMVPGHLTMTPSLEVPDELSDPSADALAYSGVPTDGRGRSRSHSKLWLMLAGVVASGLATVLLGVMDNGSSPPPLANRAAMAAPVPEVAAPAAPAAPTPAEVAPAQVDLQISSEPGGAEVEIDGKVVGVTPLELTWPKSDAEVQVLVQLDGYQAWSSALVPDRAVSLTAQLNRKARSTRRTSSRGREDSASSKAPETPPKPASYRRFD